MPIFTNNESSTADGTSSVGIAINAALADAAVCACAVVDPFNVDFSTSATADSSSAVTQVIGFNDAATAAASAVAAITTTTGANLTSRAAAADAVAQSIDNAQSSTADSSAVATFTVDSFASSAANASAVAALSPVAGLAFNETANATETVEIVVVVNVTDTANSSASVAVVLDIGVFDSGVAAAADAGAAAVALELASAGAATDAVSFHTVAVYAAVSNAIARSVALLSDNKAFWTNSESEAGSTWSNVPFNSYLMHEGQLYAAGPAGLFVFNAEEDAGVDITATVKGDVTDFGVDAHKRYPSAYVAGALPAPVRLTVRTEQAVGAYDTTLQSITSVTTHRAILGRGLTGRYARMTLTNIDGADFDVKSIDVDVTKLHRHV